MIPILPMETKAQRGQGTFLGSHSSHGASALSSPSTSSHKSSYTLSHWAPLLFWGLAQCSEVGNVTWVNACHSHSCDIWQGRTLLFLPPDVEMANTC